MLKESKRLSQIEVQDVAPQLSSQTVRQVMIGVILLFLLSLGEGLLAHSLFYLAESLFILTLAWAIYRGKFAALLLLILYLLMAKTYQLWFAESLSIILRGVSFVLTLYLAISFFKALKRSAPSDTIEVNMFGLLDILFVLMISLTSISLSAFAVDWYG